MAKAKSEKRENAKPARATTTKKAANTTTAKKTATKKAPARKATSAKISWAKISAAKTTGTSKKAVSKKKAAPKVSKTSTAYRGVGIGAPVPEFSLPATSGRTITDKDLKGKITVLYFYPKDNTPGCTLEGHDFRKLHGAFTSQGAQILGVSRDSVRSHEGFKAKCGFPFELISDDTDTLGRIFDVIQMKSLYGRTFEGIERSTFIIDAAGRLRREWRKVKVDGHAAEVLEFIKGGMKE